MQHEIAHPRVTRIPLEGGANTFETFSILGTLTGAGDGGSDAVARFDREAYIPAGATSRTHDASGNLTEDAEWTYTWDAENRLVQMETRPSVVTAGAPQRRLTFEYDSQSRRTRKMTETWDGTAWQKDEDIRFLWNDWLLSAELEADALEPIRSYTWGPDLAGTRDQTGGVGGLALVKHHKNGEVSVPLYTTNGNVRGIWEIDAAELVAEFEYGPFGELLRATGEETDKHPIRWSSKYEDVETGLVYYGYRFFDPETGRWLNRDPIEEEGGLNLYGFVGNNGVKHLDLLGLIANCKYEIVAKSFIQEISSFGSITGNDSIGRQRRMRSFASFIELLGGINVTPSTDEKDGNYRLYSKAEISVSSSSSEARLKIVETEGGSEGPFSVPPLRSKIQRLTQNGDRLEFKYTVAGRPNSSADSLVSGFFAGAAAGHQSEYSASTFAQVRYRQPNHRYIHHSVSGFIQLSSGEIEVSVSGSKFPSHILFLDGSSLSQVTQGDFAELWKLGNIEATMR